jgi:class 3 adenylate cyclase
MGYLDTYWVLDPSGNCCELLYSQPYVVDDGGRGLVWTGDTGATPALSPSPPSALPHPQTGQGARLFTDYAAPEAEWRQLTVLFCDLVDSTALSGQLDPEDLREVVRAYQTACAEVIQRFEGHIAQYLGDGLLVYFGYPQAHEDDAQRAVHTGLGIIEALVTLNRRLGQKQGIHLAVRVGIHTGLVVVGEIGGGGRQEQLALGDTPNIAARIRGLAAPDTVVISAATQRLIQGYFTCQALGDQTLKGVATPLQVYQVIRVTEVQQRFDIAVARGLTPLVGREHEVGLLRDRWAQVQAGRGHIVVLSGEAGIGKSRLVQVVKDEIIGATALRIEYRHRLRGVLLLRQPGTPQAEAETCFQQALDVARRQQAKSLELRAAMSLARLWQQQSKRTAAYDLLAPIYGWFTEGFDTADLQEAKALLDELL